jgi:hypothetical protein
VWGFTTVAALVRALGTVTAAAAGGGTGHPAPPGGGPGLTVFRVDVSRYHRSDNSAPDPGGPNGARPGPALLDVSADPASLDASYDLYFVFLMPCWGSRRGILR